MKVLIVDDESAARENAKLLLANQYPEVLLCGEAMDVKTAYEAILVHQPDLVLLDIDLPDGDAFDLLKKFSQINFGIIFITAHEQYALQAIKFSALDYLLKPYTSGEFADAMRRAAQREQQNGLQARFSTLLQNMQTRNEPVKMVLRTSESIHVVVVNDIIRLEADGNYTRFFLNSRNPILVSKNLKEYELLLENHGFFRSHQSHLVNSRHLVCFHKADGGALGMSDQSRVPVATRFRDRVMRQLEHL